ncbi:MAG: prlC [Gammaproteobacteria bacterium]|nr:prlC [Gammaproteobacteria bacterium]
MSNPLPTFNINLDEVRSTLTDMLNRHRTYIKQLLTAEAHSWESLMQPLEDMDDELHNFWSPIRHLHAVMNSDKIRGIYKPCIEMLSEYGMEISHNTALYKAIQSIADSPAYNKLDNEQKKVIEHTLRDFKLSGVHLDETKKKQFADLDKALTKLSSQFEDNVLDATHAWSKHITDETKLSGLPGHAIAAAKQAAEEKQLEGWLFTLDGPSYLAVMTYADDETLRQEMYEAYITRASDQGPNANQFDNTHVIEEILKAKQALAHLLDFNHYAAYSLATKMVKKTDDVLGFLNKLADASLARAREEFQQLKDFAQKTYQRDTLHPWDISYYSEKLRQAEYAVSAEDFRPYLPESTVLNGLFQTVQKLYNIRIEPVTDPDVWKPEVKLFAIYDAQNTLRGYFYTDLYARTGKRGGAWMDDCRIRRITLDNQLQLPVAFITCNFSGPVGDKPALFTHDEVTTLFHEFGHAIQHLMTKISRAGVSGINGVPWDAVEIASQFMESWCWEKEGLDLIARHYQTNEPLPDALFEKLLKAKDFQSAMQMVRQLQLSLFDFRLHIEYDASVTNQTQRILDEVREQLFIFPTLPFNRFQHSFSHIFAGGYAAGYYSYKWAEVLACDAFARFQEEGIFNPIVGKAFLETFLECGGAVEPMDLFIQFRGRPPEINALLRSHGIPEEQTA